MSVLVTGAINLLRKVITLQSVSQSNSPPGMKAKRLPPPFRPERFLPAPSCARSDLLQLRAAHGQGRGQPRALAPSFRGVPGEPHRTRWAGTAQHNPARAHPMPSTAAAAGAPRPALPLQPPPSLLGLLWEPSHSRSTVRAGCGQRDSGAGLSHLPGGPGRRERPRTGSSLPPPPPLYSLPLAAGQRRACTCSNTKKT